MKILRAKNKIDNCETFIVEVDKLDYGHSAIDAPGFVKLYKNINAGAHISYETMNWPLILFKGKLIYGNKRLVYAKIKDYTHIEVVDVNDENELERVRLMTCWKRL